MFILKWENLRWLSCCFIDRAVCVDFTVRQQVLGDDGWND